MVSKKLGMKINLKKTKVMFNEYTTKTIVKIGQTEVESVESYIYLG